jgi:hypothetical protein
MNKNIVQDAIQEESERMGRAVMIDNGGYVRNVELLMDGRIQGRKTNSKRDGLRNGFKKGIP